MAKCSLAFRAADPSAALSATSRPDVADLVGRNGAGDAADSLLAEEDLVARSRGVDLEHAQPAVRATAVWSRAIGSWPG